MTLVLAGQVHTKETTMILEFGTKELKTLTKQGLQEKYAIVHNIIKQGETNDY